MAEDVGVLTLLSESSDWLKDADNVPISDRRGAALEAFRSAWDGPDDESLHKELRQALIRLLDALRHNHLYPDAVLFPAASPGREQTPRYLPGARNARADFERLREFCVVNKFGMGEIHLMYLTLMLLRSLHQAGAPYDQAMEEALGDVILLRVPIYRADNLGPYSTELRARFHVLRILRSMKRLGLFDDSPAAALTASDQMEAAAVMTDELRRSAANYIPKDHRICFRILDTASALEEYARAHAASRPPLDERSADELFLQLRHRGHQLSVAGGIGETRRQRLQALGAAAMTRAMAHVDVTLGRRMYISLRSGRYMPKIRHSRMFKFLPSNPERLRFLNFLYANSKENPMYYVEKFERYFEGEKLRFLGNEVGFALERTAIPDSR